MAKEPARSISRLTAIGLSLFIAACASSSKTDSKKKAIPGRISRDYRSVMEKMPEQTQMILSRTKVTDASIVRVTIRPGKDLMGDESKGMFMASGKFQEVEFPFYELDDNGMKFEALLGVPYRIDPGKYPVSVEVSYGDETKTLAETITVTRAKYKREKLRVDPSKVSPPAKVIPRIVAEVKEIKEIYKKQSPTRFWQKDFRLPIKSKVTSPFGTQRLFNGALKSFHKGLDLRAPTGTPIRAPAPGRVVLAKDLYFTGNTVILDHGFGLFTLYAHLSKTRVEEGEVVKTGEELGKAGATGRVSGPHLHWGAIVHEVKVNPSELLTELK